MIGKSLRWFFMKKFTHKGQAALEFMMTYGWAILVVLAAIGALSYFGVFNTSRFTPDTCVASSGFGCSGKPVINTTTIAFTVVNGLGHTAQMDDSRLVLSQSLIDLGCTSANTYFCTRGDSTCNTVPANRNVTMQDGASRTVLLTGCNFVGTEVVRGSMDISYLNTQSGLMDTASFTVGGKVK
jgi:uncharacterized protein (UPF0333 family)